MTEAGRTPVNQSETCPVAEPIETGWIGTADSVVAES